MQTLLTERKQSEKENPGPYVLDHRRPELHFREVSREYSVCPHRELERRDQEEGERMDGGWDAMLLQILSNDQRAAFLPPGPWRPSLFIPFSIPRKFEDAVRCEQFRTSDPCPDFAYRYSK